MSEATLKRNVYELERQLNQSRKRLAEITDELHSVRDGLKTIKTTILDNPDISIHDIIDIISRYVPDKAQK